MEVNDMIITILKITAKLALQFISSLGVELAAKKAADKIYSKTKEEPKVDFSVSKWYGPSYCSGLPKKRV